MISKHKTLQPEQLERLIGSGKILEQDAHGPKVIRLSEHRYLKIFYQKNTVSMARLRSRARQFASNAVKLKKRGITTVGILDVFKVPAANQRLARDCVCYHGLPGDTVRSTLQQQPRDPQLSEQLGCYIAQLHKAGVMFRSLHFGNIIRLADNHFGLIDIADMRVNIFALTKQQRQRNFLHVFRYREDAELLDVESFARGYQRELGDAAGLQAALRAGGQQ